MFDPRNGEVEVALPPGGLRVQELRAAIEARFGFRPRVLRQYRGRAPSGEVTVLINEKDEIGFCLYSTADGRKFRFDEVGAKWFFLRDGEVLLIPAGSTSRILAD